MNKRMREPFNSLIWKASVGYNDSWSQVDPEVLEKFAESIVKKCVDVIEAHKIPVGNSAAGEMACEWTYDALKQIRDDIKEHFGIE